MRNPLVRCLSALALWAAAPIAVSAADRQNDRLAQPPPSPVIPSEDDIIVEGTLLAPSDLPVAVGSQTGQGLASGSRGAFSDARIFAKCAQDADVALIRDAIDGPAHHKISQLALDRLIRTNSGCYAGLPIAMPQNPPPYYGDCNRQIVNDILALCRAFYDRGALLERVLGQYAPELRLNRTQMTDPAIVKRFVDRETRRSQWRIGGDKLYFNVAACMVNLQPERALALIRSKPGSEAETRRRQWLIGQTPACVNGAKKVTVDPIQFRLYITDAIYSWAVAVRGTDSLLPPAQSADASSRARHPRGWKKS